MVTSMIYKIKFKKKQNLTSDKGMKVTYKKGDTAKATKKVKGGWVVLLSDGSKASVKRTSFIFKKQYTDMSKKYDKATAESFINSLGTKSDTEYLFWCNKYTQYVYIFKGKAKAWTLVKRFHCTTGSIAKGQGSDTKQSFSKKIYDKNKVFKGPYGNQYYNMHFSSLHGNSIHKRAGAKNGLPLTHGCIGMAKTGIMWVFNNVPINTRVVVF